MNKYNKLILAVIITVLAGFLLSTEVEGWRLPAIIFLVFAAVYGTAKKSY